MVELGLAVAAELAVGREVDLTAQDGLDQGARPHGTDVVDVMRALPRGDVRLPLGVGAVVLLGVGGVGLGFLDRPSLLEALDVALPLLVVGLVVVVAVCSEGEVGDAVHVAVVCEGDGRHA